MYHKYKQEIMQNSQTEGSSGEKKPMQKREWDNDECSWSEWKLNCQILEPPPPPCFLEWLNVRRRKPVLFCFFHVTQWKRSHFVIVFYQVFFFFFSELSFAQNLSWKPGCCETCERVRNKWHFPKCSPSAETLSLCAARTHARTHARKECRTITHIKHQQMPSWLNLTAQTQMEASGPASRVPRAYAAWIFRSPGMREECEAACCRWMADDMLRKIPFRAKRWQRAATHHPGPARTLGWMW